MYEDVELTEETCLKVMKQVYGRITLQRKVAFQKMMATNLDKGVINLSRLLYLVTKYYHTQQKDDEWKRQRELIFIKFPNKIVL